MAVERQGFEIPISTPANLAGTEATIAKLKELKAQAEAAGDGMRASLIEGSINKLTPAAADAGAAAEKLGESAQQAGRDFEESEGHTAGFHKALRGLEHELGPLGHTLRFIFNPQLLGVAALGIAIQEVSQVVEETNKKLDEMGRMASERANDLPKAFEDAKATIAEMQGAYSQWAAKLLEDNDAIGRGLTATIEKIREEAKAAADLAKAQKELAAEQIKVQESLGLISPDQAKQRLGQLDQSSAKQERAAGAAQLQNEISATGNAIADLMSEIAEKSSKAKDAEGRAENLGGLARKNAIPDEITKAEKDLGDINSPADGTLRARLAEAKANRDAQDERLGMYDKAIKNAPDSDARDRLIKARPQVEREVKDAQRAEADAQGGVNQQLLRIEQLRGEQSKLTEGQKAASEAAAALRTEISALTTKLKELQENFARLQTKSGIESKSNAAIDKVNDQTNALKNPQSVADTATRDGAAGVKGYGPANIAANAEATTARLLDAAVRNGTANDANAVGQLHQSWARLAGFVENQFVSGASKRDLQKLADQIQKDMDRLERKLQASQTASNFQNRF